MKKKHYQTVLALATLFLALQACHTEQGVLVHNAEEFHHAMHAALPGDVITLASGTWENAELLANAHGSEDLPILIRAQEKGKVLLTGLSNLRISGSHLEISGLVFKDGHTPTSEVISFREKKGIYANHCRLTECVIDCFNNPERFSSEQWLTLYGKNNRVDHCVFNGKRTSGVCMVVRLVDEACQNNAHQIDHNYFGYRQAMGSNGGETLRIGTSHYSLTTSGTRVEANYFDRCSGELEIISNKSCGNTLLNNTFYQCRGTLTFRHGHDNMAKGNTFLGNGLDNTGGIRIINERNRAIDNYFYGLKGYRFRGALVIMNGVPNSPINRYNQVIEGVFSNNSFVDCDHIQLCAGSDAERSLPPKDSEIANNIFYYSKPWDLFTVYDDISGISFGNNYASPGITPLPGTNMQPVEMELVEKTKGFFLPSSPEISDAGCSLEAPVATLENTGVNWYRVEEVALLFDSGSERIVGPGLNSLYDAIASSGPGDILVLEDGEYVNTKDLRITHPLTICSAPEAHVALFTEKADMFTIANEGALKLEGLHISGSRSPDRAGNSIVATTKYAMNRNYKLLVMDCEIRDLDVNHSFDFLRVHKHTMADSILFRNSSFNNISGNIAAFDREVEDLGIYNAEYVNYENCSFDKIGGSVLKLYRGGSDESTFGPILRISGCTIRDAGLGKRNKEGAVLSLHGVQWAEISASSLSHSAPFKLHLSNGEPLTRIRDLNIYPAAGIESNSDAYELTKLTHEMR